MGESHYSAGFNLKPSLGFNGYNTYMSGLGKWIENILSSCSPKSPRPSIKFRGINLLRCKAYTRLTVRRVGGDGLSSFEKSYKFFHTLKALAVLTLPYEKKGGGRGVAGVKISVHSELGNLQNHSCPSQNRMCQLVRALTAVTDTSDVLRLSSEKQCIMHIVRSERLTVCIK